MTQARQEQLVARAIPEPRVRCPLGDAERRVQGTRPTTDLQYSFSKAGRTKCYKWSRLEQ